MATIDKFMIKTPKPTKERLSTKVPSTSSEISHDSEDEDKSRKHEKCKHGEQLKRLIEGEADKEDVKINGEAGRVTALTCTESTVEISYEDYLTENRDESSEQDSTESKALDETQNIGRDIRSFFSKGPATLKLQSPSFTTIKVKADIHEPCPKSWSEILDRRSSVLLPGIFGKQKDGRKKCAKAYIEITDDDLVIECLDDETFKSDEAQGLPKAHAGINSTLKNNDICIYKAELITGELQLKENSVPMKIIRAHPSECSIKPEKVIESLSNKSGTQKQNMNDVLMGKLKKVQEPACQMKKLNSSSSKDKGTEMKRRDEDQGLQINESGDAEVSKNSVCPDDEETRIYVLPAAASVSSGLIKPVSTDEVAEEKVSAFHKESKRKTNVVKLAAAEVNQTTSRTESLQGDAIPENESESGTLRRSRRQSAMAAIAAISSSAMQDSYSKKQKKNVVGYDAKHETINLDSDAEEAPEKAQGHSSKKENVQCKPKSDAEKIQCPDLAPIFMKRKDSSKKSTPKLSAAEREALQIKRDFLLSGVPVELKKMQDILQLASWPQMDAPFPVHSHTFQGSSASERNTSNIQPWCLPEVNLKLKNPSETLLPSVVDAKLLHLGQLTSLFDHENCVSGDKFEKFELGNRMEISKDKLPVLLSEVKSYNPSFPVDRIYNQLSSTKNRNSKAEPTDISKTSEETSVKSKKLSKRKKGGHSDTQLETAEDDRPGISESQNLLWTEKYAPTQANEIIGNWDACKKLRDWLSEWKQVVSRHSSQKNVKSDMGSSGYADGESESSDDNSSYTTDDSSLCNTMLLLGAHGVGKTSMVYALAQELDFKVFEVNASGSRDGRYVLTQLQEATQSHQVSRVSRTDAVFEQLEEPITDLKKDKKSGKTNKPKQLNHVGGFLAQWSARQSLFEPKEPSAKKGFKRTKSTESPLKKRKQKLQQRPQDCKMESQDTRKPSLILFDEVDNVFDDDRGFWSAVQMFMNTTKRPIILTATDRHFVDKFGGRFETLRLRTPRLVNTASYVQLICLLENVRTSYDDLLSLVEFFNGDIRKTFLALQYWVDSGAARHLAFNHPVQQRVDTCHMEPQNSRVAENQTTSSRVAADMPKLLDSDEDFQAIVPRKRRRIQVCSDDESSTHSELLGPSSLSSLYSNSLQVLDDVSQTCSLAPSDFEFHCENNSAVQPPTAADDGLMLLLHRLSDQVLGSSNASVFSPVTQDVQKNCTAQFLGSHRHRNLPILDRFTQHLQSSVAKRELCAQDSTQIDGKTTDGDCKMRNASMKILYDAYKNLSCSDVCRSAVRRRLADEDMVDGNCSYFEDLADEAVIALELLVLSVSGVRWKDCAGKQNLLDETEATASEDDFQMQNNHYSRLYRENANILEGVRQSAVQPTITLCTDYMSALRAICKSEELRKTTSHRRRRFYHYLNTAFPTMRCSLFKNMIFQFP